MGVSGQRHAPAAIWPAERTPVPIVQEAGWASEPVWTQRLEEIYKETQVQIIEQGSYERKPHFVNWLLLAVPNGVVDTKYIFLLMELGFT
jgi:hypothetical protein